jgi:hypothetical protein
VRLKNDQVVDLEVASVRGEKILSGERVRPKAGSKTLLLAVSLNDVPP